MNDNPTAILIATLVLVALYALVVIRRSLVVRGAVAVFLLGTAGFVVSTVFIAAVIFSIFASIILLPFIAIFGISLTPERIAGDMLSQLVACLLTPLIYMVLVTPGLIALRRGVRWWKAATICLVPVVVVAGGMPLKDYYVESSRYKEFAKEELSLPLPQRPPRLAISQTVYDDTNIGWTDTLDVVSCTEFCLNLLKSGQVEAIRMQRTAKPMTRDGANGGSSSAAVYEIVQGEICESSKYERSRAVASVVANDGGRGCIFGQPDQLLSGAVEISLLPVPNEMGVRGQKIEISDSSGLLWRRAALEADVAAFPFMLDSDWRPFSHSVLFGSFVPEKVAGTMPEKLLQKVLTQQLGYKLN